MKRLIFDIETIGLEFKALDKGTQEFVLRYAKTKADKQTEIERLGLSPFTGRIVAIGLMDYDTGQGGVYFQTPKAKELIEKIEDGVKYVPGSERQILERFWDAVKNYQQVITFNGRSFDAPYIYIRSLALGVAATKDLMPNRYSTVAHVDLKDQLQFYGAMNARFSFHTVCRAFGIGSPKDNGVTGLDVPILFKKKQYEKIARYCMDDVRATRELYAKWLALWAGTGS